MLSNASTRISKAVKGQRESRIDWLLFATLLVMIINSGGVQYYDINVLTAVTFTLQLAMFIRIRWRFSIKLTPALLLFSLYLVYAIVILPTFDDLRYVMIRYSMITSAFLTLNYVIIRKTAFGRTFSAVLIFLVIHGFISWALVSTAFSLFTTVPEIRSYHFLKLFFGMSDVYFGIHRSQGLFWEPGVYAIYLNIALHYFLFYENKKWSIPTIIGLILTLSTTGVVIAGIQIAYFSLFNDFSKQKKLLLLVILAPAMIFFGIFAATLTEDKISGSGEGSFLARSFDTRNGIQIALSHPFGIGFNNQTYQRIAEYNIFNVVTTIHTDRGQTNGIVMLLYSTGWFWAAILLYLTYRQRILPRHSALFFLVLCGSLLTEPLFFSPFVFLFVVSGAVYFIPEMGTLPRTARRKQRYSYPTSAAPFPTPGRETSR